jgi:hypothetical protein
MSIGLQPTPLPRGMFTQHKPLLPCFVAHGRTASA